MPSARFAGLPADQRSKHAYSPPCARKSRQNGTLWTVRLKERFILDLDAHVARARPTAERGSRMTQPRLLLIDDEPALADFLANAARDVRVRARRSPRDDEEFRDEFLADAPGHGRARSRHARDGRRRAAALPRRAGLSLAGADRQRLRPPRAGIAPSGSARRLASTWPARSKSRSASKSSRPLLSELKATLGAMIRKAELGLLASFERALSEQRLHMVYQPKVVAARRPPARGSRRWSAGTIPSSGAVEPSRFVPLAEEHGLIDDLTQWGLRTILRQWLDWRDAGPRHLHRLQHFGAQPRSTSISPTSSSACAARSTCRPTGWCSS